MTSFQPLRSVASRAFVLDRNDVDTDQIIPARFLTTTSRAGLGRFAFYDWRFDEHGRQKNDSPFAGVEPGDFAILVAGSNFGCGSSREHAPWALLDFGFRAVVSSDIADIFKSNALKNGLLPVTVDVRTHQRLLSSPGAAISIDLDAETLRLPDGETVSFKVEPFARRCLLDGVDPLGFLLDRIPLIEAYERESAKERMS
ncbi:MAG: 3-isopropylmalate dehydratase small subunit [Parvularculaceae bacterium]|jgi:3-isopropylmalate/(R)-2-methylmalate dehydratase small subunit|nr:3-isopropylmalate dehydratase small subunit [Parvularculaceae bacterium]